MRSAAQDTVWRCGSVWIEQADGTCWADLIHVSTGTTRTVSLPKSDPGETRRAALEARCWRGQIVNVRLIPRVTRRG